MPDCDSAGTAERSYPASELRGGGREDLPHAPKPEARGGREELPHAPTPPRPRPRAVAWRSNPMPEARGGGREDQPHAKGKRNPSKTVGVARGHQRADTLKPYSQKTSQSNHTRTTLFFFFLFFFLIFFFFF